MKEITILLEDDFQVNLLHGLLVDEEIRLKERIPQLLIDTNYNFDNVKTYVEEVKKLRKAFTQIDRSEDIFEVFSRIEDHKLDKD